MNVRPHFEGQVTMEPLPDDMMARIALRVDEGLLQSGIKARANYRVEHQSAEHIRFVAADWWTAINVGLNDVTIRRLDDCTLHFSVTYWGWARYAIGLCAAIVLFIVGGIGVLSAVAVESGTRPFTHPLLWGNVLFWGVCWPWILIALHKRPARRCLERILRDVAEG